MRLRGRNDGKQKLIDIIDTFNYLYNIIFSMAYHEKRDIMNKEIEIVSWIFYILGVILLVIVIWMLVLKLTGHSPTEISVLLWAVGILATLQTVMLTVLFQVNGKIGEFTEFKRQTIERIRDIEKVKN